MSLLLRATDLIGRPVVTIDSGDDVAELKDVVYGTTRAELLGFTLRGRGFLAGPMKNVLPFASVAALGRDAVMIEDTAALAPSSDTFAATVRNAGDGAVLGDTVLTDDGTDLGSVVDVIILCSGRPDVVGYEIDAAPTLGERAGSRVFIPLPDTLAVSGQALMVPKEAREFIVDDLAGFGASVERFRARLDRPGEEP